MARMDVIQKRVDQMGDAFGHYVQVHDEQVPFTGEQLAAHRACIALRRRVGSVRGAVGDEEFINALRRTLRAWGIGVRGSRLVSDQDFRDALYAAVPSLEALKPFTIDASNLPEEISSQLWLLIDSLGVVENKAKIVAGTKTLHHLLPDLVVPMDRAWTGTFFQFHLPEWQDPSSQRRIFRLAYSQFAALARSVQPQQYVTGRGWRTSRSKVIDNALIGYCKAELSTRPPSTDELVNQVSFEVAGYPPAKSEALSMLGSNHGHTSRVRLLLEMAGQACSAQGFVPVERGHIGLDVVLRAPAGQNRSDATNYLGGIGDVLEDKSPRGCAGINRHGGGDGRALRRRSSDPRRP